MTMLPFRWVTFCLGDVCRKIGSGATPRGGSGVYLDSGDVALIRSQNVHNDGFHHDGIAYLTEEHAAELENVEVQEDDVLLNITGDSVARCCQVDPQVLPARVNQHVAIIRPDPKQLDPRFLRYFLVCPDMQARMLSLAGAGGTRNALTKGMIESFEVPAPKDVREQRAIAAVLGALDDKIELNRRMCRTLEGIARAIFQAWFVDFLPVRAKAAGARSFRGMPQAVFDTLPNQFTPAQAGASPLGPIPKGWEVGTLGELCEKPEYGYTASACEERIGPKFLRITDINKKPWIDWATVPYCEVGHDDLEKYRVRIGDILIARMADPGHGVFIEESVDAIFASYLIRFRAAKPEYGRYLQYWLRSADYWHLVGSRQAGTTRASLNAQVLGAFPILLPVLSVLACFQGVVGALRDKVVATVRQSATLAALRDALLPKLVSGELRIRDVARIIGRCV